MHSFGCMKLIFDIEIDISFMTFCGISSDNSEEKITC